MIWLSRALQVNCPLKDILTGRNPGHKGSGNFQKVLVLTLFFSHWWAWYSISPLWLLHQQPLWQGLSTQQSCWICIVSLQAVICYIYYSSTGLCEKLLHICIFFIIPFIIIVYVFVFQNIIIEERNFYVFTIFRDSQLVFVPLKKTFIFRILWPKLFDPYCQFTNYSWATILSWLSLPNDGINYFLMKLKIPIFWNIIFNCCSFLTLMWRWHQALVKKFRNLLLPISIPHLTLSPPDRMMGQSFLDYLNLLHAQGVTLEDAGKSGLVQN